MSGGIDSAVVACIASYALGNKSVYGVSMPSKFSSEHSKFDAEELAKNLNINYQSISIQNIVDKLEEELSESFSVPLEMYLKKIYNPELEEIFDGIIK